MPTLLTEREYAIEARIHMDWLCWIFGLTTFLLSITALQFTTPWKIALLGLGAVIPMYVHAFRSFPPSLYALRQLAREGNAEAKNIAIFIEKKYHGWSAVRTSSIAWISLALYVSVLFSKVKHFSTFYGSSSN
ncbi:hypothetical protein [Dokdonella soli]|uniref:hypothetical protein n=1 Tax=Dokdonella soli TaxID=529810 RepID=UPI0031D6E349